MDKQKQFLNLFFNENELVSLVKSKFDTSISTQEDCDIENGVLLCLNPLKDTRKDENVSAYRSFLVEVDDLSLKEQKEYIEKLEMPYSCCVYSGNKSLHYGIVLDQDLPTEQIYRYLAQWILNIVSLADKNCKNPSRSIRFPNNARPDTCKIQHLIELKQRISLEGLYHWLTKYPNHRPIVESRPTPAATGEKWPLPSWVQQKLENGINNLSGRNVQWFGIGCEFAKAGYTPEETLHYLEQYFQEDYDFKYREFSLAVNQGFKQIAKKKDVDFR